MSLTKAEPRPALNLMPSSTSRKVAAGASVLFAVALFWTVAAVDVPHEPTDAALLRWWEQSGNRMSGVISGMSAICAAILFTVVMNYLRSLTAAAKAPQWLAFARSMGAAVTAVWLVTGATRAAIGHLVDTMNEPLPATDVLRYATAINYTLLGVAGMTVLALSMLGVSVVVLRTDALSRWVGYVGAVCAIIVLAAALAQVGSYATLVAIAWALCLAVAIWRQPTDGA